MIIYFIIVSSTCLSAKTKGAASCGSFFVPESFIAQLFPWQTVVILRIYSNFATQNKYQWTKLSLEI